MGTSLDPTQIRKVTEEDKEAAEKQLLPLYGNEGYNETVRDFAQKRKLTERQVIAIVLHLLAMKRLRGN